MKVTTEKLFPTTVYCFDNVLEYEYIDSMKKDILKRNDKETGQDPKSGLLHKEPKYKALAEKVKEAGKYVLDDLLYKYDDYEITGMWSTVLKQHAMHRPHTHSNNFYSGVFYVQSDKDAQANIQFYDPRPQADVLTPSVKKTTKDNSHVWFWPSTQNRMLLFPAWLQHYVTPNPSVNPRISIAFNIMLKGRVGDISDYQSAEF